MMLTLMMMMIMTMMIVIMIMMMINGCTWITIFTSLTVEAVISIRTNIIATPWTRKTFTITYSNDDDDDDEDDDDDDDDDDDYLN